jgi:peroxiredoxin
LQLLLLLALAARPAAPDFELRDSHGVVRRLSGFRGKVVVLNFWATWCPPCRAEIPWLETVHRDYAARGFTVLGVAMDERGWPAVTPFLAGHKVNYPVLLGTPHVARQYGGLKTLPRTVFLDRHGRIVATHDALLGEAPLRKIVELLLTEAY